MANTIVYGQASNEGPNGGMQTSQAFTSRGETASEAELTKRAAHAAFKALGVQPVSCRVYFFGNGIAKVTLRGGPLNGRWVTVRDF